MNRSLLFWTFLGCLAGGCQADFGAQTQPGESPLVQGELPTHGEFEGSWQTSGEEVQTALRFVISCDGSLEGEREFADGTVDLFHGDVFGAAIQAASSSGGTGERTLVGLLQASPEGGIASGFWESAEAIGLWHVIRDSEDVLGESCPGS